MDRDRQESRKTMDNVFGSRVVAHWKHNDSRIISDCNQLEVNRKGGSEGLISE